MNKTFYTVKYWIIGALSPTQCWFDSKEEAEEFSLRDFADAPVRHTFRKAESIAEAEQLVEADRLARKYHYK